MILPTGLYTLGSSAAPTRFAFVAERLRRLTRNQLGSPCAGSSPAECALLLFAPQHSAFCVVMDTSFERDSSRHVGLHSGHVLSDFYLFASGRPSSDAWTPLGGRTGGGTCMRGRRKSVGFAPGRTPTGEFLRVSFMEIYSHSILGNREISC